MKSIKYLAVLSVLGAGLSVATVSSAADKEKDAKKALKPYLLNVCAVSDEKLGEMGDPFVFDYKGREIKLCCKSCKKDFDKEPAKFVKKLEAAEKKAAK